MDMGHGYGVWAWALTTRDRDCRPGHMMAHDDRVFMVSISVHSFLAPGRAVAIASCAWACTVIPLTHDI